MMTVADPQTSAPSDWLRRHAHRIRPGGQVLEVAAGRGRNARWLARQGFHVEAVDRDADALRALADEARVHTRVADLEQAAWPYPDRRFDAVVVCNYLHRPLFDALIAGLASGGVLIYETFMQGHEAYGRPRRAEFLLRPQELLARCQALTVVDFFEGFRATPKPAMVQAICAIRQEQEQGEKPSC